MQRSIVLPGAFLAFGLFCYFTLRIHSGVIQQDLLGQVRGVLASNQIPSESIKVDGRDVVLSGPAGSREVSERTQELVGGIDGVRSVEVRFTGEAGTMPDAKIMAMTGLTRSKLEAVVSEPALEFSPASAQLTARGRKFLDRVASLLAGSPTIFCEIEGYADSPINVAVNRALGFRRALEVKNYLVNKGIAAERLSAKISETIASNKATIGQRRINFVLKEKP